MRLLPVSWKGRIAVRVALLLDAEPAGPTIVEHNPSDAERAFSSIYKNSAIGTGFAQSQLLSPVAWVADKKNQKQWIEIPAPNSGIVVGIRTQGRATAEQWTKTYQLQAQLSDGSYQDIDAGATFNGNTDRSSIVEHRFNAPADTVAIRVLPRSWQGRIALRAALLIEQ